MDSHQRIITAVIVTLGAVPEDHMLEELLERQPVKVKGVCADSQYGSAQDYAICWNREIKPTKPKKSSPRKKNLISPYNLAVIPGRIFISVQMGKNSGG